MKYEELHAFFGYVKENRRMVIITLGITLLMISLQMISAKSTNSRYLYDDEGRMIGIVRNSAEESVSIPLNVNGKRGKLTVKEELIINLSGKGTGENQAEGKEIDTDLAAELRGLALTLDQPGKKRISLPSTLEDGTKLLWEKPNNSRIFMLLLMAPLVLVFFYRLQADKERKRRVDEIAEIRKELPAFNSKMLLLLNSGLIFNDAFIRIAQSYGKQKNQENQLGKIVNGIVVESKETSNSLVSLLDRHAKQLSVRELSRIVGIMMDNQYKGINLIEKLDAESEILWVQRKKDAEEKGKLAETKLAFPLAMLLIVLILITAAPAILQI